MGNATLIETLKDDIAAGRVVVIAGTGVSVATSGNPEISGHQVATWTGLLGHGIDHGEENGEITTGEAQLLAMQLKLLLRPHEVSTCGVFDPGILEVAHYPLG